jgi:hypothetical protein
MKTVYFDCGGFARPSAATVQQIARLKLAVKRYGCKLELGNVKPDLAGLIYFVGLDVVLGVELQGQAEQRKQLGRVEEEGQLDDLSAL